jgi:hypothetical protein
MIKERSPKDYKCSERNNCEINALTRNMCRACRFKKCLIAGMSIQGSRIGRQSNLFKHKIVEMQRRGLIQSQLFTSRKKTAVSNQGDYFSEDFVHYYRDILHAYECLLEKAEVKF